MPANCSPSKPDRYERRGPVYAPRILDRQVRGLTPTSVAKAPARPQGPGVVSRTTCCDAGIIIASVLPLVPSTTCRLARIGHGPGGWGLRGTVLDLTVARMGSVPPGSARLRY